MFLFDTDVITNILKKKPSQALLGKLSNLPKNQQYISTITVSEIVYGAFKSNRPEYHLNNLENILLPAVNVVGFDTKAAAVCGQLRAELEQKGQPLDLADLEIASIAIAGDFTLVTGNTRHFGRIEGLRVKNWLKG
ncbi:MAG: type II toxin-antitoxin system VapC family toxin [Candidatus Electrothrix aestuarii]|uniref:Type II toxin-antitoxin system VapC family toxin n=1 Tax=Candidatus Electrothrix aestuarii TaxID=3062594 RepID=A0AAU8LW14_9BACT|nr:type II toxin-antitoxin system VapC family toxin [Candidatus Electrothrix aestuarii]